MSALAPISTNFFYAGICSEGPRTEVNRIDILSNSGGGFRAWWSTNREYVECKRLFALERDKMAELAPSQQMIRQFMEIIPARAILVAAKLGLADHIDGEGATSTQVASNLDADPDAVHRLLRVLASIGVLHEGERDSFTLTSLGETLRSDSLSSVRSYAVFVHDFIYEGSRRSP